MSITVFSTISFLAFSLTSAASEEVRNESTKPVPYSVMNLAITVPETEIRSKSFFTLVMYKDTPELALVVIAVLMSARSVPTASSVATEPVVVVYVVVVPSVSCA